MIGYQKKIGLGTVQFGLDYGINNSTGMVGYDEVTAIINYYRAALQDPLFDTAIGYGESEKVLGKYFAENDFTDASVVSKFSAEDAEEGLTEACEKSLERLQLGSLYGFLAHNASALIDNEKNIRQLTHLKEQGLVKKTGFSAYHPAEIEWFLERKIPVDLVQVPYNIFDRRFQDVIRRGKEQGMEIHSRSAFLQGLIFKEIDFFKEYFSDFKPGINFLRSLAEKLNTTVEALALAFCCADNHIDRVMIGVDNAKNLEDNFSNPVKETVLELLLAEKAAFLTVTKEKLIPSNWPAK